jgi:WD40 repeat protein/uncharacterized caspase-like protein
MCPASIGTSRSSRALETGEAKLWVLLIGVNRYQDDRLPALSYSALDCQGLGEAIAAATQAFPEKSIVVHHDFAGQHNAERTAVEPGSAHNFAGQPDLSQVAVTKLPLTTIAKLRSFPALPPTLDQVRRSFEQMVAAAKPQDTVLVYFSGHGLLESDRQQAVLCLTDTHKDALLQTGLTVSELLQTLGNCAAHQQLVWLDACHSGVMTLRSAKGEAALPLPNPTPQLVDLLRQRAAQSKGFYALLSCDQTQQSWEFPELGHGVFTYYLMRGLLGEAADAQGVIEADALYKYVYYQTLRYIDRTNQQLRLINQQKRGRGDTQIQPEYPLQTPKRIVEGVGELILGLKPTQTDVRYPRQALVVDGLGSPQRTLALGKVLRGAGGFELNYLPQPGKAWTGVQSAIQTCLRSSTASAQAIEETALLYLRGEIEQTETGESLLVLRDEARISRSWLRQELRRSTIARQILILDCPGAVCLDEWVEDLQTATGRGQCLIAAAAPNADPDAFAQALLETLTAADPQTGLPIAGWIAQLQGCLAAIGITPYVWLSGTQGVIEVLPGKTGGRGSESDPEFDLGLCPYMGLRAFDEDDAPFFFGRETLTQRLLNALSQQALLAVVGASGSGKSSIVHAGLVAALRQGKQIPDSETWWIRSLRPGAHPLEALAQRLVDSGTEKERAFQQMQIEGMLHLGVEGFVHWLRSRPEPMVVLVIDQFEELFTLAAAEDRQRFLHLLLGAIEHAGDRFKLVLTLRTDFIASCLEINGLAQHLQRSSLLIPPHLAEADYRQIILKPAEKVGLTVDPELVEVLLQELSHGAGDLPLLEFVLEQVWEHRQPGELTLQVYQQQVGGLKGALERKAQAVYDSLDPAAQACARWIFLSLTQLGEGTEDTRRRILKSELTVKKYPAALIDRTLHALTAAKLIVVSLDEAAAEWQGTNRGETGETTDNQTVDDPASDSASGFPQAPVSIEVAHEILIRHWSTLRWWLEENRSRLRSQRQIQQAAQQWQQSGQQSDFLLQGVRLDAAEELYVKYTDELSQDVQQFIEAGLASRLQQQQTARRQLRRAQIAVVLIGALGTIAAGLGSVAYLQRQQAQLQQIAALNALSESQLLAHHQLEALTTSVQAGHLLQRLNGFGIGAQSLSDIRTQTVSTLQQAIANTQESNRLEGHSQQVNQVSVSPANQSVPAELRGALIATASDDATIRLWQPDGQLLQTLAGHQDRVTSVAFSATGGLASGSTDRTVRLWNATDGSVQATLSGHQDAVTHVAFSADGQMLASASRDRTVQLWHSGSQTRLRTLVGHTGWVNSVSFSPDRRTLATGSEDNTIRLWSVADGRLIRSFMGHTDRVTDVAFSPDGKTLASASGDHTVRLWNVADGASQLLQAHADQVNSVSFSPDGQRLVSTSLDRTLHIWQVDSGALLAALPGHGAAVLDAAFSSNGQTLVSGSADKTARVWQVPSGAAPTHSVDAVIRSDNTVATAEGDGTIQIWRNGELATTLQPRDPIAALSLSPDGQTLAVGGDSQAIELLNANTGNLLRSLTGHQGKITSLAFSASGQLASASEDKTVRLWNPADGSLIHTLQGHQDGVTRVMFSPNGELLASGSYDNTVKLWRDGTLLQTLAGHRLAVAAIAFSPDGQTLATGSWDNTITLWRVSDGTLLQTLTGHQDGVTSLAFSPDGHTLASGSADQTIKLWNSQHGTLIKTLLRHTAPILSLSFSADGSQLVSVGASLLTWQLDLADLLQQGCDRLHNYLQTNPHVEEVDRTLCS